jgi:hypothetical protein
MKEEMVMADQGMCADHIDLHFWLDETQMLVHAHNEDAMIYLLSRWMGGELNGNPVEDDALIVAEGLREDFYLSVIGDGMKVEVDMPPVMRNKVPAWIAESSKEVTPHETEVEEFRMRNS